MICAQDRKWMRDHNVTAEQCRTIRHLWNGQAAIIKHHSLRLASAAEALEALPKITEQIRAYLPTETP